MFNRKPRKDNGRVEKSTKLLYRVNFETITTITTTRGQRNHFAGGGGGGVSNFLVYIVSIT